MPSLLECAEGDDDDDDKDDIMPRTLPSSGLVLGSRFPLLMLVVASGRSLYSYSGECQVSLSDEPSREPALRREGIQAGAARKRERDTARCLEQHVPSSSRLQTFTIRKNIWLWDRERSF